MYSSNLRCDADMTTMTDEQVLGEIGWTMQIINDLTGLVPAFWRPPYGISCSDLN
jgi:peptidoglycan/xylan/chitin deacetylase (PgdA/CDA1 family)